MSYRNINFVVYIKSGLGRYLYIEDTITYKPVYRKAYGLLKSRAHLYFYSHIFNQDLGFLYKLKQPFLVSLYKKKQIFRMENLFFIQKRKRDMRHFSFFFKRMCRFNWYMFFQIVFIQALDYFWIAFKLYNKLYNLLIVIIKFKFHLTRKKKKFKFYNLNKSYIRLFSYLNCLDFFIKKFFNLTLQRLRIVNKKKRKKRKKIWYFKFRFLFFKKTKFFISKKFNKISLFLSFLHLFGFICNVPISIKIYNGLMISYLKSLRFKIVLGIKKSKHQFLQYYSKFSNRFRLFNSFYCKYLNKINHFFVVLNRNDFERKYRDFHLEFNSIKTRQGVFTITMFALFDDFKSFQYLILYRLQCQMKKKKLNLSRVKKKSLYFTSRLFSRNRDLFNSLQFHRLRRPKVLLSLRELIKTKFVNMIMRRGRQMLASKFVKEVFFLFKTKIPRVSGSKAFLGALLHLYPFAKLCNYKISGRKEKIFAPMTYKAQLAFGIRLLINNALKRRSLKGNLVYNLVGGLFFEIYDISVRKKNCLSLNFMKEYNYLISSMRLFIARRYSNVDLNFDLNLVPLLLSSNKRINYNFNKMKFYLKKKNATQKISSS